MTKISAHRRLRDMPEVFTTNTLAALLDGDRKAASVYLNRWRKEGHISSLGPRVGVHFNLVRNPNGEEELRMEAIGYVFPGSVVAGVSAVHAAGWTTQIPSSLEIMIPTRPSIPELDGIHISKRPARWFRDAKKKLQRAGPIPTVDPAFALADLWKSGDWRPDEDDLEWDEIDTESLKAAFDARDIDIPDGWMAEVDESLLEL